MSDLPFGSDEVPLDVLKQIDEICAQFETALSSGSLPQLEIYLQQVDSSFQAYLFRELLLSEMELLRSVGATIPEHDYQERFPQFQSVIKEVLGSLSLSGSDAQLDFAAPGLLPGSRAGPYEIIEMLGQGGMGTVYRACDTRLEREVAIKVLPEQFSKDPKRLALFEREAKAVSRLSHPNVIVLHDVGWEEGTFFVVMELLRGKNLREHLSQKPFTLEEGLRIGRSILQGLSAVHAQGVIHRDLKPENLFLTRQGEVKILDFGLAQLDTFSPITESGPPREELSSPNRIMGTVGYMSPEQAQGRPADARSDIFAFGCALYEMLLGEKAFARGTVQETLRAIVEEDPPELADPHSILTSEVKEILKKCLTKNPDQRWQTADELARALDRLAEKPLRRGPFRSRLSYWMAGGLLTGVILLCLFFFRPGAGSGKRERSLAILPFAWEGESREPQIDFHRNQFPLMLIQRMRKVPDVKVMSFSAIAGYESTPKDVERAFKELDVGAVLYGTVRQNGVEFLIDVRLTGADRAQLWGKQYRARPRDLFHIYDEIGEVLSATFSEGHQEVAKGQGTQSPEALRAFIHGQLAWNRRSTAEMQKALSHFQRAVDLDPSYAEALAWKAFCYITLAERNIKLPNQGIDSPRAAYKKAQESAEQAQRLKKELPESHIALGMIAFESEWDFPLAEEEFRKALKLDPNHQIALQWYAEYLSGMNRPDEALARIREVGERDPYSPIIRIVEGVLLFKAGRIDEAIAQLEKTLEKDKDFLRGHGYLALFYEEKGRLREAVEKWQMVTGGDRPVIQPLREAAYSGDATLYWKKRLELHSALNGPKGHHPLSEIYKAILHLRLDQFEEALAILEKALQERDGALVPNILVNPGFDRLRKHPEYSKRYLRLVDRIRAPSKQ